MFFCSTLLTLPQNPQLNLQAAHVRPGDFILFIPRWPTPTTPLTRWRILLMCPNGRTGYRAEILCVETQTGICYPPPPESMSLLGLLIHRWSLASSSLGGSRIPVSAQKTHSAWMATSWRLHLRVPLSSTFYFIHNLATPKTTGTLERAGENYV